MKWPFIPGKVVVMKSLTLRRMEERDLPQVRRIEKKEFSDPWSEADFWECLQFADCWVFERAGVVHGYGVMSVEADQAHIVNLCVRPESRKRGLGRRIITHLLETARSAGAQLAFLEVRASNETAIRLYRSLGFCQVGVQKAYYPAERTGEDALILAGRL